MSRTVTLDLDDAGDVQTLWSEYARVRALRDADPELLGQLERLLPMMPEDRAAEIREALAYAVPSVVLAEFQDDFFAAHMAVSKPLAPCGMPKRTIVEVDPIAEQRQRDHDDPARLAVIVDQLDEILPTTIDVAEAVLALARAAGIPDDVSSPIITEALRRRRRYA